MGLKGGLKAWVAGATDKQVPLTDALQGGPRVAIDASCWLFKGMMTGGDAAGIAMGRKSAAPARCLLAVVQVVRRAGGVPLVVFDGACWPAKQSAQATRRKLRSQAREAGQMGLEELQTRRSLAISIESSTGSASPPSPPPPPSESLPAHPGKFRTAASTLNAADAGVQSDDDLSVGHDAPDDGATQHDNSVKRVTLESGFLCL